MAIDVDEFGLRDLLVSGLRPTRGDDVAARNAAFSLSFFKLSNEDIMPSVESIEFDLDRSREPTELDFDIGSTKLAVSAVAASNKDSIKNPNKKHIQLIFLKE